ncbi:MAG TPA: hypothetical protein VFX98_16705 [Longimicrobiaceae bacterium]|nr:hypothetical protein [Longimicrobiaceae bacterium]
MNATLTTLEPALPEARTLLERASTLARPDLLRDAADRLARLVEADPGSVWARYHLGYAHYRMASLQQKEKKAAVAHLATAVEHLRAAAQLDPNNAEARALLSTCYGMQIRYAPLKAPWLGERKTRAMAEALHLEPENPRVMLLRALQYWSTPGYAGGDKEAALDGFHRAVECFEVWEPADPLGPVWGHPQALAYLGMAYLHRRDEERARDALAAALRIAPDYHWVKHVLLPQLGIVTP